ncbi:hypothetical protein PG999_000194 [Apiospora kogelbergensis]|uniref:Nephrocystin 3-like N-terminal domain-containing protein n=1 Tax=Apiospora kogelbergensis TaxID=1337665 RepID=A0AAW0RB72_9PEZI
MLPDRNRKRPASDQDEAGDGARLSIRRRFNPEETERSPAEPKIERNRDDISNTRIDQGGSTFGGNNNASGSSNIHNGNTSHLTINCPPYPNTRHGNEPERHRQDLLESLRFTQIDERQMSVKRAHAKTCRWFLKTTEYVHWSTENGEENQNNFLWIKGKPGAGKSTLMKVLFTNHLQLLEKRTDLQRVLDKLPSGHRWTIGSLQHIFEEAVQSLGETVFCYIDALDECEESQVREMTSFLRELDSPKSRLYTCLASRHYPHITVPNAVHVILEEQNKHYDDIAVYVRSELHIGNEKRSEAIRLDLQEKASGVFMWVVLVVEILNKEYDAGRGHTLRKRLEQIPKDLHALFHDILTRDGLNTEGLLLCMQWLLFAKQPLTQKELYFAIMSGLEPAALDECHSDDLSEENMAKYILNYSKGLAELNKSKVPTMQFIHESVRDFLLKEKGLHIIWPNLNTNIAGQISLFLAPLPAAPEAARLREQYANQCILYHAEHAEQNGVSQSNICTELQQADWVHYHNLLERHEVRRYTESVSLLYILAETDLGALISAQPAGQSCFHIENERYGTAIIAALVTGSATALEALLKRQDPQLYVENMSRDAASYKDRSSAYGRTFKFSRKKGLLSHLTEIGHPGVLMHYLAAEDGTVNFRDEHGRSPLSYIAERGYADIAKLLIEKGADINTANRGGSTPLYFALSSGRTDVAKLLIEKGANINIADQTGTTPLHQASFNGYRDVAELLIEKGADVNAASQTGSTPLLQASFNGRRDVAELLIEKGANVNAASQTGSTPLYQASARGYRDVAKLLIEKGANVNAADETGWTPLYRALARGAWGRG